MKRTYRCVVAASALIFVVGFFSPSRAEVASSSPSDFKVKSVLEVTGDPLSAFQKFTSKLGVWWNPEHTYSGNSANMSIDAKAGGCFCEKLGASGGVVHMTVLYTDPGKTLRMSGGLGPLQSMSVVGVLTVAFTANGPNTKVEINYAVGGPASQGLDKLAAVVDQVLTDQWGRFARYANTGKP